MRTKQYLCAIRAHDGALVMSTMVYADEVNDPAELPELAAVAEVEVNERELAMAEQLIESLAATFEPESVERSSLCRGSGRAASSWALR